MGKKLISAFIGVIFLAFLVSNARAQMGGREGHGMPEGGMMGGMEHRDMMQGMHGCGDMMDDDHPLWKHLMGLGLDDKQKDALRALRSRTMKEMVKKSADEKIADIELRDLLAKDPVDMKAVETAVKKKESIKTEMFLAHVRAHEEMKALLTPDQRKQLKEMMAKGCGEGCSMMGGMGHGHR